MVDRCVVADQRVFGQVDQQVGDLMPPTTTSPTIKKKRSVRTRVSLESLKSKRKEGRKTGQDVRFDS